MYKYYPVPARRNVFQNQDLAFPNEESRFTGMMFLYVIALSRQTRPKWMFMYIHKACKDGRLCSKLKRDLFLHKETGLRQQVKNILG